MIKFLILVSLALYGSKVLWQEGMILEKPKKWLDSVFGKALIRKPLYACPPCMASIWGSAAYWINFYDGNPIWYILAMWPLTVIAISGIVWILLYQFPFDD